MKLLKKWKKRRNCLHHVPPTPMIGAFSFIKSHLIDIGMKKYMWCTYCGKSWIV